MPDNPSTAELRQRIAHHDKVRADAEARRAELVGERAENLTVLSDPEVDELDAEIAHLAALIERAGSRATALRPALASADRAESEADDRAKAAAAAAQDRLTVSAAASLFGAGEAAIAAMELRGAAIPERPINQKMWEPPMPTVRRDDAAWWAAREAKERDERAARLAANMGQPAHAAPYR